MIKTIFIVSLLFPSLVLANSLILLGMEGQQVLRDKQADFIEDDNDKIMVMVPVVDFAQGNSNQVTLRNDCFVLDNNGDGSICRQGCFVSKPQRVKPFDYLMIAYGRELPTGTLLRVLVRTWPANGSPSMWREVGQECELPGCRGCEYFQYRLELETQNDTSPSLRGLSVMTDVDRGGEEHLPMGGSLYVESPPIIERSAWGARRRSDKGSRLSPREIIVHHTATNASDYVGAKTIRQIQSLHMDSRHWSDLGYHFLIGPDGKVYRGRKESEVGAHAPPNSGRFGVSLVGNFEFEKLKDKAKSSLVDMLAHLCSKYDINPKAIKGHREVGQTLCPGADVVSNFANVRRAVVNKLSGTATD